MDQDRLNEALEAVVKEFVDNADSSVHGASIGLHPVTGEPCVLAKVVQKKTEHELTTNSERVIPRYYRAHGKDMRVKVVEAPIYKTQQLFISSIDAQNRRDLMLNNPAEHRRCHNNVPGGAQCQPQGAGWVGTWGVACKFQLEGRTIRGGFSNNHVLFGGQVPFGAVVGSPDASKPFGTRSRVKNINFQGGNNVMDWCGAEAVNPGNGRDRTSLEMIGLGKLNPRPRFDYTLGMTGIRKTGRTTGVQKSGRIVEINVTTMVDHGGGKLAKFVNQIAIRSEGQFSNSGDSGSLIMDAENRPLAHLHAGGGGTTIASPIKPIVEEMQIEFFG